MSKRSKSLVGAVWAGLVVVALAFGTTQVMASPISVCTGPGEIGRTCPPEDDDSCNDLCQFIQSPGGYCNENDCCECIF